MHSISFLCIYSAKKLYTLQKGHIDHARKTGVLSLADNNLEKLPSEIKELTQLRSVTLSRNKIPSLPPFMSTLSLLKTLLLDNNRLNSLPEEFSLLKKLETLNISFNSFSVLPKYVLSLLDYFM